MTVQAQQYPEPKTQAEVKFCLGFARGSFGDNIDRPQPGFVLSVGGKMPRYPLILIPEFGLHLGF